MGGSRRLPGADATSVGDELPTAEAAGRIARLAAGPSGPAVVMLGDMDSLTEDEVARRAGVTPETLRSWVGDGLLPRFGGTWTPEVAAQARLVARLQARGHSPSQIRDAEARGALAFGGIEHLLGTPGPEISLAAAAEEAGLEPGFATERISRPMGFPASGARELRLAPDDVSPARRHRARRRGRAPARRAAAAAAGLRPGARAGRRRRGAALPPLRPRAADAGRRARRAHRRGDGGPRRASVLPLAAPIMDRVHRRLPAALRRPGRHRAHGGGRRRRGPSSGGCASRSRSPTSPATRG